MFKKLAKRLFGGQPSPPSSDGFFLNVRCNNCGEVFNLFINKSWELGQNIEDNGSVSYFLQKEIVGAACRNRIYVKMQFDRNKNLVSREIQNGKFIE
ncbi:MAG: hypothetical protein PVI06_08465 [Desulfobacterales bacterium]|jgi:hypothetical protein